TQKLSTAGAKIAERTSVKQARCRVIDGRASALPLFFMLLWSMLLSLLPYTDWPLGTLNQYLNPWS
ncbi:hypothetical protein, partial [Stecheria intestinalis]|uniref:hypothetical protein n=1 Tax=Stecheria intestinalis TaxID=2606630 RepID=UPI00197E8EB0